MTVAFRPPLVLVARAVGLLVTALVASACLAAPAQADELADFETARALYEAQRYPESVECLERLLAGDAAQRLNRAILLEARKYLAAGFLFVSRPAEAEREFALLLAVDPEYQLDSGLFPAEIRVVFTRVRARVVREERERAARVERAETALRAAEAARILRESDRLAVLRNLAMRETVIETHSRWLASLPFGVGQFQNGHAALGAALAVGGGALAGAAITLKLLHDALPTPSTWALLLPADQAAASALERGYRIANQLAMAALATLAVVGVIDAQIRFVPAVTRVRSRPLPPDADPQDASATLGIGPSGARFLLRF